jgi:hypothetical protein
MLLRELTWAYAESPRWACGEPGALNFIAANHNTSPLHVLPSHYNPPPTSVGNVQGIPNKAAPPARE